MVSNTAACDYNQSGSVQHSWCSEEMTKGFTAKSLKAFYCPLEIKHNWGSEDSRIRCTFASLTSVGSVWDTEKQKGADKHHRASPLFPWRESPPRRSRRTAERLAPTTQGGVAVPGRARAVAACPPAQRREPIPQRDPRRGRAAAGREAGGRPGPAADPPREGLHQGAGLGAGRRQKRAEPLPGGRAPWLRAERQAAAEGGQAAPSVAAGRRGRRAGVMLGAGPAARGLCFCAAVLGCLAAARAHRRGKGRRAGHRHGYEQLRAGVSPPAGEGRRGAERAALSLRAAGFWGGPGRERSPCAVPGRGSVRPCPCARTSLVLQPHRYM